MLGIGVCFAVIDVFANSAETPPPFVSGEVLVRLKQPEAGMSYAQSLNAAAEQLAQKTGADIAIQQPSSGIILLKKPGVDAQALAQSLMDDPAVEAAQPNTIHRVLSKPLLWSEVSGDGNKADITADEIWKKSTGEGVVVAVIDSGVDHSRADLADNIWKNIAETDCADGIDNDANGYIDDCRGWDFTGDSAASPLPDNDPMDGFGHGTSIARIIAAADTGSGRFGIAPDAMIMPLKVIDHTGYAPVSAIVAAIGYAIDNGADIINMSISATDYDHFEAAAVAAAYDAGIVLVASAGNEHASTPKYPASYPQVLAVSAVDSTSQASRSSNFGDWIDLAAPGGYTSAATPHVAATAALVLEEHAGAHPAEIGFILTRSALDLGTPGKDDLYGYGLVDAYAALFPPRLSLTTQIPAVVSTAKPTLVLQSSEAGMLDFDGSCRSSQLSALAGQTPIVLDALPNGTYSDCRLTVTDALDNRSNVLDIPPFTVRAPLHSAAPASGFFDLHDHWGADVIDPLVEQGILNGYGDGSIRPDASITRAEALKLVLLAFDHPVEFDVAALPFRDVSTEAWYLPYIAAAKAKGFIAGFADGTFRPDAPITRAEALKLVSIAAAFSESISAPTTAAFVDVSSDAWYFPFLTEAMSMEIVSGYADGSFRPNSAITRAEFCKIVFLSMQRTGGE